MKEPIDSDEALRREILCALARHNCIMMLETRGRLEPALIARVCEFVSTLCVECDDEECKKQSVTCREAAEVLRKGDAVRYMELCLHACGTCPFSSRQEENEHRVIQ